LRLSGIKMIDRTHLLHIDWILIGLLLLNSFIGVAVIHSSSHYLPGQFHLKQMFWIAISLIALFVFLAVDYNYLVTYSPYFYAVLVIILGGMLLFGIVIAGTKSWIRLPFLQIQPSELMKIAVILLLALLFFGYKRRFLSLAKGIQASGLVFLPVALISLQPDPGTAFSYLLILFAALILAGLTKKTIVILLILAVVGGFFGWNFLLKEYQKERLVTLVSPEKDPLGSGYHVLQSKIAIGSGGFLGKGYKKGTQSQLKFLPARHTDFVFSVIGEEFGFMGVVGVLVCYFLFLARLFQSCSKSRDRTGVYIIFMVAVMISSQFIINVFMTIGLFPIAGIPLPLLSYGGSSLLTNYLAVSLVLNVKMRRFVNV
jgi:rod shape determining protein RodA